MSACFDWLGRIVSYKSLPDFTLIPGFDGYFFNWEIWKWNYVLYQDSILNIFLNFPFNLDSYLNIHLSESYCLLGYNEYSLSLGNFSFHDLFLIAINFWIIILFILGLFLIFKQVR